MSKAMRCDRCGKYYDLIPENLPGTKTGPKYSVNYYKQLVTTSGAEVQSFDLCPECAQQLTNWAENQVRKFDEEHGEERQFEKQEPTQEAETEEKE